MVNSPFQNISKPLENKLTLFLLVSLVFMFLTMRSFDEPLKNSESPFGIISLELAKELSKSEAILNSWDPFAKTSAAKSMSFDFLFIIVYSLFFSLLIHKINERLWIHSKIHFIGVLIIWGIFLAAFCDIIENVALIKLLAGDLRQIWSSIAYYFAIFKFSLLALGFLYVIINSILIMLENKFVRNKSNN